MDSPFYLEGTRFYSQLDERAHFEWIERIACVRSAHGHLRRLYLDIDVASVSDADRYELTALYRRYDGDLEQLKALDAQD
ncbi:hypothetical protein [uncultured Sphingomonas sp.]|uniref:hypothetical protein n=1 Tax=uncultured Sphingomonas sp. TaxID=158754 RepID=UPI0025F18929|nr:hypothetical protein [uncultured Sphingomonas sp.]